VPEIFAYWLQGGRIDVGFLGAAQIDRLGNLNSTVIGDYERPKVRLPGGGGAPEIAAMAKEVIVMLRQSRRSFVNRLDFRSSVGYGDAPGDRKRLGMPGRGPTVVITDLGVLRPDPESRELTLTQIHPGMSVEQAREETGWPLRVSEDLEETEPPSDDELRVLRELRATLEAPA
jgi:glutaconate CoA-transferase, subunit B